MYLGIILSKLKFKGISNAIKSVGTCSGFASEDYV